MTYGLIARKLSHSFSKIVHNMLFDYDYELLELEPEQVEGFMLKKDFKAINVTIPYKETVIPYLDYVSDTAKAIGAVNTIVNKDGKLYGYNTDFFGMTSLIKKAGIDFYDKNVLILGSGGTCKTSVAVARHLGCRRIDIVSRNGGENKITYEQALLKADTHIIINSTPCGMFPDIHKCPIDIDAFENLQGVIDAIYNPLCSQLVLKAKQKGIKATGGLYMLIAQAALAAEKFIDTEVPESEIDRVYNGVMTQKQNIVLIGMPASGKSSVGKILAQRLNMPLIDTDTEIEKISGRSIPEIFAKEGEASFRNIETEVIKQLAAKQGCIIATGGGAILREQNVTALKQNGVLYFLDRNLDLLITTSDRPLSSTREALTARYNERYDKYLACCDKKIDSNGTPADAADAIERSFLA